MLSTLYKKKLDELLAVCHKNIPANQLNDKLISQAFQFSLEAHKNDKRASGEAYFSHPYEVATIIAKEIALDDVSVAAALLHDVVEDTKFTIKDIRLEFGEKIAEIVDGATKIDGIFENYELKQVESYRKMLLSMTSDIRVMLIKFADRLHNLRTLEFLSNPRQMRIAQETLEIFAPFAHRFGLANVKAELEDLSFKFLDRPAYDELAKRLNEKKRERDKLINRFIEPIKQKLIQEGYRFEIYGRAKHLYSIYKKLKSRNKDIDELYDLFAVRIVLDTTDKNDCFSAYGICSSIYIPIPDRFKDYISLPKQNGYQSIHTTLVSKEGKMVEVQIRTKDMHEVAEKGVAAHWKYKENTNINDENLENWMRSVRESLENASKEDNTSGNIIDSFKLNLYQDEIYCFTPKGELKILPANATAVDFAFDIHTEVGSKCIGAKINGKIVTLDTKLKSGDQIEIITSKNQTPKRDWEKFVITHKAKSDIRKYFNVEKRQHSAKGREIWDKKVKKNKLHYSEENFLKVIHKMKYKEMSQFFYDLASDEAKADTAIEILSDTNKLQNLDRSTQLNEKILKNNDPVASFDKFINDARSSQSDFSIGNANLTDLAHSFAKCCHPIPGDELIGFITKTDGVKIHRKNCKNLVHLFLQDPHRIVDINWSDSGIGDFTAGIKIIGEDRAGILNDITNTISKNYKVNIKSVNVITKASMFEGNFILQIANLKQLNDIIEKINQQEGVFSATRFDELI